MAIVPALDEEKSLPRLFPRLPGWLDGLVVVDNGSMDATAEIARSRGALVVSESRRGYGAACQRGVATVLPAVGADDVIVFLDADGSDDPAEMASLVDPVLFDGVALAVGCRAGRARMLVHQRVGTAFVAALLSFGFGVRVSDLGPFRAIRAGVLASLGMRDHGYGWTAEMQARALRFGWETREVPVSWRPGEGPSKVSGSWQGSLRAGRDLTRRVVVQIGAALVDGWIARRKPASRPERQEAARERTHRERDAGAAIRPAA